MAPVYARCFTKMHELLHGREKVRQEQGQRQEGKEQKQEQVRSSSSECSQSKLANGQTLIFFGDYICF